MSDLGSYRPEAGETVLYLDPGQAFGTGGHASTRLCLEILEDLGAEGEVSGEPFRAVLDVGTGTGILALVAALFKAGSVLAIDTDPLAMEAAREHAEINRLKCIVRVQQGGPETITGTFSLILANLTREDLLTLAGRLKIILAPGGLWSFPDF